MQGHIDLNDLLREARERIAQGKWKRANPYVLDLIEILYPHTAGLERSHVIAVMETRRRKKGLPVPRTFDESVQSAFQGHSSQSAAFRGGADLFYWPKGKGSGIWAVHRDRAENWLAENIRRSNQGA